MSIGHILLAAAIFAIPVLLKYFLAFETRSLVESLRSREEEVRRLSAQWRSLERERLVMRRAINQVRTQKRHAAQRRERLERADLVAREVDHLQLLQLRRRGGQRLEQVVGRL